MFSIYRFEHTKRAQSSASPQPSSIPKVKIAREKLIARHKKRIDMSMVLNYNNF